MIDLTEVTRVHKIWIWILNCTLHWLTPISVFSDEYETNGINLVLQKYSNNKDVSQKEYLRACKVCGVIPLTTFLRQLGDRNMSLKFQLLPKNAIKSCAIALLVRYITFMNRISMSARNIRRLTNESLTYFRTFLSLSIF